MHTHDHLPYSLQLFECSGNDPGDIRQPGVSRTEGTVAQDGLNTGENIHVHCKYSNGSYTGRM